MGGWFYGQSPWVWVESMKDSFWELIWSSFQDIQGVWIGLLGFIGSVILVRFPFKTPVPLDFVIIVTFFTLLFLFTLFRAISKVFRENQKLELESSKLREINQKLEVAVTQRIIPKIRSVQTHPSTGMIICLLESSDLFANLMMISCFHTNDDGFEYLIGVGYVQNIQSDGQIQVAIDEPDFSTYAQDILNRLVNNDKKILDRTVVKPGTRKKFNLP